MLSRIYMPEKKVFVSCFMVAEKTHLQAWKNLKIQDRYPLIIPSTMYLCMKNFCNLYYFHQFSPFPKILSALCFEKMYTTFMQNLHDYKSTKFHSGGIEIEFSRNADVTTIYQNVSMVTGYWVLPCLDCFCRQRSTAASPYRRTLASWGPQWSLEWPSQPLSPSGPLLGFGTLHPSPLATTLTLT